MFGERLRQLRLEQGMSSQQALAEALGVSQSTVANWEGGRREPGFALTERIADYFQVTVDYLLGRSDQPQGGGVVTNKQLYAALWGAGVTLAPATEEELWGDVREYAQYRLQHYRRRDEYEQRKGDEA